MKQRKRIFKSGVAAASAVALTVGILPVNALAVSYVAPTSGMEADNDTYLTGASAAANTVILSSIETQKQAYEKIIRENPDYELAGIYADRGISGGSTKKRVQFRKMMQDCCDGKVDLVLTKSISRFARNLADTLECIRELKELGIPVSETCGGR